MNSQWDSELPQHLSNKLNLLLKQRNKLGVSLNDNSYKSMLPRHRNALITQTSDHNSRVESLLEIEKSALIDALDRDVWRSQSPGFVRSIFNNSRSYVSINNPSSKELKQNKTFRSNSTNAATPNSQYVSMDQKYNSIKSFKENDDELKYKIDQQQQEIYQLKLQLQQNNQNFDNFKQAIQEKLVVQKSIYEDLLHKKEIELNEANQNKSNQIEQILYEKKIFEDQIRSFKENLMIKLQEYAKKLDEFNKREEQIKLIEQDNVRLKQEKEELQIKIQKILKYQQKQ